METDGPHIPFPLSNVRVGNGQTPRETIILGGARLIFTCIFWIGFSVEILHFLKNLVGIPKYLLRGGKAI